MSAEVADYADHHAGTPDPFAGRTHRAMTQAEVEERVALNAANTSDALAARAAARRKRLRIHGNGQP